MNQERPSSVAPKTQESRLKFALPASMVLAIRNRQPSKEISMSDPRYDTFMGHGPQRIMHWEHWSNPDAATYLSGIDFYEHPRQ